mgnify:CR=1 FL=1
MACPVSGTHHSWWKCGLDVIAGKLRRVRRCVWCGAEKSLPY